MRAMRWRLEPVIRYVKPLSGALIALVLLLTAGGLVRFHTVRQQAVHNAATRWQQKQQAALLAAQNTAKAADLQAVAGQQTPAKPSASPTTAAPAQTAATPKTVTKYAISSDPRSTAYSTTPPAPNPASFNIPITRARQVAAGTVISYNATKGERTIYGGDLVLDTPTMGHTQDPNFDYTNFNNFNVSVPDGATVGMPSQPYNDTGSGIGVGMDASQYKAAGNSFNMKLDFYNHNLSPGYHVVHLVAYRTAQTADEYEYDGFITVNISN